MKKQPSLPKQPEPSKAIRIVAELPPVPISNFTLSSVCPACNSQVSRRRCKVFCPKCGFVWDCSEL